MIEVTVQRSPEVGLGYNCRVCNKKAKVIVYLKWGSNRPVVNIQMCKLCLQDLRSKIDALTLLVTTGEDTQAITNT